MSTKEARGTKRTCQNPECGSRYYDLNRNPIQCPLCGAGYAIASAPASPALAQKVFARRPMPPQTTEEQVGPPDRDTEADEAEALPAAEIPETPVAEADETVLEEDDDGGDVSGILDAPVEPSERDV